MGRSQCQVVFFLLYLLLTSCENDEQPVLNEHGEPVSLARLVKEYSLVCPVTFCMPETEQAVGFNATTSIGVANYPSDCIVCSCRPSCKVTHTCCPDLPLAYEKYECLDTTVWGIDGNPLGPDYLLKASCSRVVDDVTRDLCEGEHAAVEPVLSIHTITNYKNEHCAQCDGVDKANLIPWPISMVCTRQTPTDIQTLLQECIFVYSPAGFAEPRLCEAHPPIFDKCNMTGLWLSYDADVDFACTRFNQPYGKFRNLFCYVCNPSKTSIEVNTARRIDKCPFQIGKIAELCKSMPASFRLYPYKNIYCKICNEDQHFVFKNKTGRIRLSQMTGTPSDMSTLLEVTVPEGYNMEKTINGIFKLLTELFISFRLNFLKDKSSGSSIENITSVVQYYASVCGVINVCNKSYLGDLPTDSLPEYRPCPRCDCAEDCAIGRFPCCVDKLLEEKINKCVKQSNFLNISFSDTRPLDNDRDAIPEKMFSLISECPKSADKYLKTKCSGTSAMDTLEHIPVLSPSGGAFRNIYCLKCYKLTHKESKIFMKFSCDSYFETILFTSLEDMFRVASKLKCDIAFTLTDDNLCYDPDVDRIGNVITKCNFTKEWITDDKDIREACEHTDLSGIMNKNLFTYTMIKHQYKNSFCAICNPELGNPDEVYEPGFEPPDPCVTSDNDTDAQLCDVMPYDNWWGRYNNVYCFTCQYGIPSHRKDVSYRPTSFVWFSFRNAETGYRDFTYRSLFSVSRAQVSEVVKEIGQQCVNGAFDHVKGECVDFYCPGRRILKEGRCVHAFDSISEVVYLFNMILKLQMIEYNTNITVYPFSVCLEIMENIKERLRLVDILDVHFPQCVVRASSCNATNKDNHTNNELTQWKITTDAFLEIKLSINGGHTDNLTVLEDIIIDTLHEDFIINYNHFIQHHFSIGPALLHGCQETFVFSPKIVTDFQVLYRRDTCILVQYRQTDDVYIDEDSETLVMNDGRIKIPTTDVQQVIRDGQQYYLICKDSLPLNLLQNDQRSLIIAGKKSLLDKIYIVFSSCCTGLSLFGLFLTFMTYCLFPDLRTVPGKNNMHLSLCLFTAQAGLQYSLYLVDQPGSLQCKLVGVLTHYFWLASFCAMNTCSYHMYRVFFAKSMLYQSNPHQKLRVAVKYACYIYIAPFVIVSIVVTVQLLRTNFTAIGYGQTLCFIDDFYMNIFCFILPSGLITLTNIVFYILTFYRLRQTPRVSSSNADRHDLVIYAKLCSITGVMWPLVFVDAMLDLSVFSFLVTLVTSLQGMFIFISFVCNKRVLGMYIKLGGGGVGDAAVGSGQSVPHTFQTNNSRPGLPAQPISTLS